MKIAMNKEGILLSGVTPEMLAALFKVVTVLKLGVEIERVEKEGEGDITLEELERERKQVGTMTEKEWAALDEFIDCVENNTITMAKEEIQTGDVYLGKSWIIHLFYLVITVIVVAIVWNWVSSTAGFIVGVVLAGIGMILERKIKRAKKQHEVLKEVFEQYTEAETRFQQGTKEPDKAEAVIKELGDRLQREPTPEEEEDMRNLKDFMVGKTEVLITGGEVESEENMKMWREVRDLAKKIKGDLGEEDVEVLKEMGKIMGLR